MRESRSFLDCASDSFFGKGTRDECAGRRRGSGSQRQNHESCLHGDHGAFLACRNGVKRRAHKSVGQPDGLNGT